MRPLTKSKAIIELLIAGLFWGFGFIGTVWCLEIISPAAILFYRFFISFLLGFGLLVWQGHKIDFFISELKIAWSPGVYLWLTLILQTWALKYTTATNSTFITTLYVVLVPLINSYLGHEKLDYRHWICVVLAFIGTGFIVEIFKMNELNRGDLLTLFCSFFAAAHILSVGFQTAKTRSSLALNTFQGFWISLFSLALFPLDGSWKLGSHLGPKFWIGLTALGFGSSFLAFLFQVRAQKVISPSVVSLMFLLESPMSCIFAFFLLGEKLTGWQWMGAFLILLSCILVSLREMSLEKPSKSTT